MKILFIGNSMIRSIPEIVEKFALRNKINVRISQSIFGAATFSKHLTHQNTLDLLEGEEYDIVLMHEQSKFLSFPPFTIDIWTTPYALQLDKKIKADKIFMIETPGYKNGNPTTLTFNIDTYTAMQKRLFDGYSYIQKKMSNRTSVLALTAWRKYYQKYDLWNSDGVHPNSNGYLLIACNVFFKLFNNTNLKECKKYS